MPRGIYRDGDYVHVNYEERVTIPISRALYESRGYEPPCDKLPTKAEYDDDLTI